MCRAKVMRLHLIFATLASWIQLFASGLESDSWKRCRDYTVNACSFDTKNIITTSVDEEAEFCQYLCSDVYTKDCKYFHYDRPQKICQIYGGNGTEPYKYCDQFAGPPAPTFSECETLDQQCHVSPINVVQECSKFIIP